MKRLFIAIAFLCGMSTYVNAVPGLVTNIIFSVGKIKNGGGIGNPLPKSPATSPEVTLDDHTLTFDESCSGCVLYLVNEDDEVEYTTVITSDTLVLPSTLEGQYEIQIIQGEWCFYGDIEL
jgi:hypothetical protein